MSVRWSYTKAKACAKRIRDMRFRRAQDACRKAGLDVTLIGLHPHNAMVSLHYGKPWKGIDYHYVRLCLRLLDKQWDADRILDRYVKRRDMEDGPMWIMGKGKDI